MNKNFLIRLPEINSCLNCESYSTHYYTLKRMYDKLLIEHLDLKKEYSENFMIESMNDMKKEFEVKEQEIQSLKDDLKHIKYINTDLINNIKSISLMSKTIINKLKEIDRYKFINRDDYFKLFEIQSNLKFIEDVIKQTLKTKNEFLYLN